MPVYEFVIDGKKYRTGDLPAPPSEEQIQQIMSQVSAPDPATEGSFNRSMGTQFLNNLMAAPRELIGQPIGEGLAFASAGIEEGITRLTGSDRTPFSQRVEEQRALFPANAFLATPKPEVQDFQAGFRSLPALAPGGEAPDEAFERNRLIVDLEDQQRAEQSPFQTIAGEIAGDVLSIIGMRAPGASAINRAESRLRSPDLFFKTQGAEPGNLRYVMDRTLLSAPMKKLARGAGRTAEAGIEAAMLEILHGEDELETAAFAMMGQATGSALLEGSKGILSGGPTSAGMKIFVAAASIGSLWQLMKESTPGGQDRILDSIETGYGKVAWGLGLGAVAAMAGSGRLRGGELAGRFPVLTDAIATLPRATVISVLDKMANSDEQTASAMERVMSSLVTNPEAFGPEASERIAEALDSGDISAVIESLANDLIEFDSPPVLE